MDGRFWTYDIEKAERVDPQIVSGAVVSVTKPGEARLRVLVKSCKNWGTTEDPDWYIEGEEVELMLSVGKIIELGPIYVKQKQDGVSLVVDFFVR